MDDRRRPGLLPAAALAAVIGGIALFVRLAGIGSAALAVEPASVASTVDAPDTAAPASALPIPAARELVLEPRAARPPTRTAKLRRFGRAIDARNGVPLAGATIGRPAPAPGGLLERDVVSLERLEPLATSAADGRFELLAGEDEPLVVQAAGFAPFALLGEVLAARPHDAPRLALAIGGTLRARVLQRGSRPGAGVTVRAIERIDAYRFVAEATSDAEGIAQLANLPPGRDFEIELTEGRALLDAERETLRVAPHEVIERSFGVDEPVMLCGVVRDQHGDPVAGARVSIFGPIPSEDGPAHAREILQDANDSRVRWVVPDLETQCDGDGRYLVPLEHQVQGAYVVLVLGGVGPRAVRSVDAVAPDGAGFGPAIALAAVVVGSRSAVCDVTVDRGLELRGRLVAPDGSGVAGALIEPRHFAGFGSHVSAPLVGAAGRDGHFGLSGISRNAAIPVGAMSWDLRWWTPEPVTLRYDGTEKQVVLEPTPWFVVASRDRDGHALDLDVVLIRLENSGVRDSRDRRRFESNIVSLADETTLFFRIDHGRGAERDVELRRAIAFKDVPTGTHAIVVTTATQPPCIGILRDVRYSAGEQLLLDVEVAPAATLALLRSDRPRARASRGGARRAAPADIGARVLVGDLCLWRGRVTSHQDVEHPDDPGRGLLVPPGDLTVEWILPGGKTTESLTLLPAERRVALAPSR